MVTDRAVVSTINGADLVAYVRYGLGSSFSAKMAWLTQCVYELKQENQTLKAELAAIKAKLGME